MIHHRKSPRWLSYDYTSPWWYFVTIVTKDREHYFGEIVDGRMLYSEVGKICDEQLHVMIAKRPSVDLHEYIIMPNHVHILLVMSEFDNNIIQYQLNTNDLSNTGDLTNCFYDGWSLPPITATVGADYQSDQNNYQSNTDDLPNMDLSNMGDLYNRPYNGPSLSSIIKLFKWNVTKYANHHNIAFWRQRSFHDHIIRNQNECNRIKYYIQTNPIQRNDDRYKK